MCRSEICLGYLLFSVILGFSVLIFVLLKYRKYLLAKDLQISAETIWQKRPNSVFNRNISKADFIFGVWQDKSIYVSELVIKNSSDVVVGRVEHQWGSREYLILIGDQKFRVELPFKQGGVVAHLMLNDGKVEVTYERKTFSLRDHNFSISNYGVLNSKRSLFTLRQPVEYFMNETFICMTCQISAFRKVGRIGFFSVDYPLHIKIFILAICF